ncbi:hypothetical protein SAMN04488544_1934 [Microlunatus sagamiharensis]|uniref:Fibronectin type-III domain-containing protein n=1 Tax=Microlunatus sagamiharensis TaxID=546874 RepID=A0A1H2MF89_9ACTN|nr:hypothetical protein [Microlunatus sagamiharensis]SDU91705.1 hypothetical protein SAMN04488544_1934 [Microlunatus sagamiharensis]
MFRLLRAVLVGAAASAVVVAGAQTASAESYTANCYSDDGGNDCYGSPPATSGLDLAARARYTDETNKLCVADTQADGRSSVGVYWPAGEPGKKVRYWNHSGSGSTTCAGLGGLRENADYRIQVCLGEWAKRAANRVVIACGPATAVRL